MLEEKLLNRTLELLENESIGKAYNYLKENKESVDDQGSSLYNFLYCLAALDGNSEESLKWLEEAILDKGYWYRPEVFDDKDLDLIRDEKRFKNCIELSKKRYEKEEEMAMPVNTWQSKTKKNILFALHGNQQNIQMCKNNWETNDIKDLQIEYLQSEDLDSYGIFRWENIEAGSKQLEAAFLKAKENDFKEIGVGGFSAGCNIILKSFTDNNFKPDYIILQSPWIPVIDKNLDEILEGIRESNTSVYLLCGLKDEDCYPYSKTFAKAALTKGIALQVEWIEELGHEFSTDFNHRFQKFIGQRRIV